MAIVFKFCSLIFHVIVFLLYFTLSQLILDTSNLRPHTTSCSFRKKEKKKQGDDLSLNSPVTDFISLLINLQRS